MSSTDPVLRASDAERERTADLLREHCSAGRLTPDELDERIDAAFGARTVGELRALLADLPALPAPPPRIDHDAGREAAKRRVLHRAGWWTLLFGVFVVLWLMSGAESEFWPVWILFAGAIRMVFVTWSELGPGADERRRRREGRGSSAPPPQQT
ncbi:DUF1707 SHOCT-like domain-containing protein [Conexibacter woesei]|uniref:DUF1707 domain-containing protein n=1 Tax=Conexibacter woesei (strain DSM 14684 / CCUG 47730 / CIP 108061 / JCM 11494 / NBRC 100937 / ID131577) TaxID=469383 RepID=D3F4M1_CONWI|nr:DUF1707 domain-containing protein [Conexibacter woesei]ADB52478.1 protein of unknown function DUF1707 [Conexibacter woesei DSM 14684]